MNNKTVLVTGATGFLGRSLVHNLLIAGANVIGTGYSEGNIKKFERIFGDSVKIYSVDIAANHTRLKNILIRESVDYVIHAAALKHVGICENNPTRAIDVNVQGSKNVIEACVEANVKNAIAISTDKSINPLCTYGMTKKLMETMFLEHNFGVFQGVNFLFSSESVLDVWDQLRDSNDPLLVNTTAVRYFCTVQQVCDAVLNNIETLDEVFSVDHCYRISISSLQDAYSTCHDYWNVDTYTPLDIEKVEEELPLKNIEIISPEREDVIGMFRDHYNTKV
jgi:UDP-N-acetylglucosamine 4,6-dehydratase